MEQNQRFEEGHTLDNRKLIERGHLMLRAIASQARAARAEAQKAELELALIAAQEGDPALLRNWMQEHQFAV